MNSFERAPELARRARIHVSVNEKVAESVIYVGDHAAWRREMFKPNGWDLVRPHIRIDSREAAERIKGAYSKAKVLIVIRDQADWLHSAYRYFMPRLQAGRRSFADFCATPRGIVYLQAGHYDVTIAAYIDTFGPDRVKVLRFEDLVRAPERFASDLGAFVGLDAGPLPATKANEGSAVRAAMVRKYFPFVDAMPAGVRKFGGRLISMVPGRTRTLLSESEIQMIRGVYALSNERTAKLIAGLAR